LESSIVYLELVNDRIFNMLMFYFRFNETEFSTSSSLLSTFSS
jgi:hypothetical protein